MVWVQRVLDNTTILFFFSIVFSLIRAACLSVRGVCTFADGWWDKLRAHFYYVAVAFSVGEGRAECWEWYRGGCDSELNDE